VMQSEKPDIHIIGHWNYPESTKKTMYVAASQSDRVELFLNGKSLGVQTQPATFVDPYRGGRQQGSELLVGVDTGCIYGFPDVAFAPGTLKAVASKDGKVVAQTELATAGAPAAIRLTVHTGPHGLLADGSDVVLVDFEVVDSQGRRCPTDEARVDFAVDGPAVWRGGLNSAMLDSTNNLYLSTECGINRVAIRSTQNPGTITLKATRDGLTPAEVKIESKPAEIADGLETHLPQVYDSLAQATPGLLP